MKSAVPASTDNSTRVCFDLEALRCGQYVLLVDAAEPEGALHAITRTLRAQGARILSCKIETEAGIARHRFDIGPARNAPLTGGDLWDIQRAVLTALPGRRN